MEPRLVPSTTSTENPLPGQRHEVIFVDSNLPNRENLVGQLQFLDTTTEVVELNALQNGLEQISRYLSDKSNLDAIHVLSNGQEGSLFLANSTLDTDNIDASLDYLSTIGNSLTQDGDILLYQGAILTANSGRDFVARLAEVTSADVATSDFSTGNIETPRNWVLEANTAQVYTTVATSANAGLVTVSYADPYTFHLGAEDLDLSSYQQVLQGRDVVVLGESQGNITGMVHIGSLTGLSSLQILAPTTVTIGQNISVSGTLSFAGSVMLLGSDINLSASDIELGGPLLVGAGISATGGANLTITSAMSNSAIQLGGDSEDNFRGLWISDTTLGWLNHAGLSEMNFGNQDH
ncbi:MAG: DUF4347 domain-containing protein, partial [Planctomycetia bacterium]